MELLDERSVEPTARLLAGAFREKLGFELTHERVLGRALSGAGFTTWAMVRRARRSG